MDRRMELYRCLVRINLLRYGAYMYFIKKFPIALAHRKEYFVQEKNSEEVSEESKFHFSMDIEYACLKFSEWEAYDYYNCLFKARSVLDITWYTDLIIEK